MKLFNRNTVKYVHLSDDEKIKLIQLRVHCFNLLEEMVWTQVNNGEAAHVHALYDFAALYKDMPNHYTDGFAHCVNWYTYVSEKAAWEIEKSRTKKSSS